MYKITRKLFAICLTLTVLFATVAFQSVASASTLLEGPDRYATALKIVQAGWAQSDNVIIARGDDLADALAAAPLAYAKEKAPILLTKPGKLPTGVLNELKSLKVKNVYIVGGTGAVSTAVEKSLKDFTVKRITGRDRVETSYKIALEAFKVEPERVVIANGLAYSDALSVSSIAAVEGMPILLVVKNKLTDNQVKYIEGKTVYAIGGMGVLSQEVVKTAKAVRISGADRYETNAEILGEFKQDYSSIYIAKGNDENLVDALAGSALAAMGNNPIVLVSRNSAINSKLVDVIKANINGDSKEILLGGEVEQSAADAIEALKAKISLNKTTDNLTVGDTDSLIVAGNPNSATVIWTTSNPNVATVTNGVVTAVSKGTTIITATISDGNQTAKCTVNVNNEKGYVNNSELDIDLKVRTAPSSSATILGQLYNYEKIEILEAVDDNEAKAMGWYKINYTTSTGYVSEAYIQLYTSPPDDVVSIARNISKQFEVGNITQVVGSIDKQGLSMGYFQWNIGQGTLQPLLNRMERQYPDEMKAIFGTNYDVIHKVIVNDTLANQLIWTSTINNSNNDIIEPWKSQFASLCNNQHFKSIEADAEVYIVNKAMIICKEYNLKTIRGFALAFDIALQNGSISADAIKNIDIALNQTPNMTEKALLKVIANVVANSVDFSEDVRSRKLAIVNGQGTVHGTMLYLDANYGLSDKLY